MVHENTATMSMLDEMTSDEVTPDETISLRDNQEPLMPSRHCQAFLNRLRIAAQVRKGICTFT